jgi:methylmalonyl-CoA mutase N-terminal domain/subunit
MNQRLSNPGEFPYTRGVYREMYRSRLWTMRQYAGMFTAVTWVGRPGRAAYCGWRRCASHRA